jgi:hypothetical protein
VKTVTVTKVVKVEIPCLASSPPVGPSGNLLTKCPEGLEMCFTKEAAFILNEYIADLIHYSNDAWDHCKEEDDHGIHE